MLGLLIKTAVQQRGEGEKVALQAGLFPNFLRKQVVKTTSVKKLCVLSLNGKVLVMALRCYYSGGSHGKCARSFPHDRQFPQSQCQLDTPLAKAKPISDDGSTCGITSLRREEKKHFNNFIQKEE